MRLSRAMTKAIPEIRRILSSIPIDFGGGCSLSKALILGDLCSRGDSGTSVDVGVYRGRSFFPQAIAFRALGRGTVLGVDPFSSGDAVEVDNPPLRNQLEQFVRETDFDALFREVALRIEEEDLARFAGLRRQTSGAALPELIGEGIRASLVHIDGNHDTSMVMEDVRNALTMVEPGGFIVIDDISWSSVRPAVDFARGVGDLVYARVDSANDFAVYRVGGGVRGLGKLRARTAELADLGDKLAGA